MLISFKENCIFIHDAENNVTSAQCMRCLSVTNQLPAM